MRGAGIGVYASVTPAARCICLVPSCPAHPICTVLTRKAVPVLRCLCCPRLLSLCHTRCTLYCTILRLQRRCPCSQRHARTLQRARTFLVQPKPKENRAQGKRQSRSANKRTTDQASNTRNQKINPQKRPHNPWYRSIVTPSSSVFSLRHIRRRRIHHLLGAIPQSLRPLRP
jgi:hypothetical protein